MVIDQNVIYTVMNHWETQLFTVALVLENINGLKVRNKSETLIDTLLMAVSHTVLRVIMLNNRCSSRS